MYPSVAKLEQAIYTYLSSRPVLITRADIAQTHPRSQADLTGGKGRVVIGFINDMRENSQISRGSSAPSFQFVCYAKDYANSRRLQELVITEIERWGESDFLMSGQRLLTTVKINSYGPAYETDASLYMSNVEYRFSLTLV